MYLDLEKKADFLGCGECMFSSFEMHKKGELKYCVDFQCLKMKKFLLVIEENYQIGNDCPYKKFDFK